MQPIFRFLLTALFAMSWTGLAVADTTDSADSLDPSVLRAITNMQLDSVFEETLATKTKEDRRSLHSLAGPTSMDCTNSVMRDGIETCVVSTHGNAVAVPAALAQH